jgi:predicted nucleotidyltransferase
MGSVKYKAIDNPLGFIMRTSKPQRYPTVTRYEDFTDEQKSKLSLIKSVILSRVGECHIGVYGSQVRGNYDETSDYDIMIYKAMNIEDLRYIKGYNYGFKVDIHITPSQYDYNKLLI